MGQTDKGILIFYEWLDAMESLSPKNYKALMTAICRLQQTGEEPPEFQGFAAALGSIIFPFIRSRHDKAKAGRMAMYARHHLDDESIKVQETLHSLTVKNQEKT